MSTELAGTRGVYNRYGQPERETGLLSGGASPKNGIMHEAIVYVTGDDFNSGTSFNTQLSLPAGSFPQEAIFEITEVFTVGNADNVINIGTDTSESTNGFAIADPETAEVTIDTSGAGTWAASLAAATSVGVSVTGTTAAITAGSGKAKVTIRYYKS